MTRLFAFLPLLAGVLASANSGSGSGDSSGSDEIEINIGPVQIKVVGSFSGTGKWDWQAAKPGENATIHQVIVGGLKDGKPVLAYDPPSIDALPGDFVQFNFKAQSHSVTQSTLEKPCVKMEGGMDSGLMPNPNDTMPIPPSMIVAINDTQPLWFYCSAQTHCGKGMAFGINPGGPAKMAEFMANALAQNGTATNGTANGLAASNSTSGGVNGLGPSSAIASPTGSPLADLVPGDAQAAEGGVGSAGGAGAGSADGAADGAAGDAGAGAGAGAGDFAGAASLDEDDVCNCNCLCDLGQPGMGGMIGSIPLPDTPALGRRSVKF